jgi:hypothetical protein
MRYTIKFYRDNPDDDTELTLESVPSKVQATAQYLGQRENNWQLLEIVDPDNHTIAVFEPLS